MSPDQEILSGKVTLNRQQQVRWRVLGMRHIILRNTRPRGGQYVPNRTQFMGPYYGWLAWIIVHVTPLEGHQAGELVRS